MIYHSENITNVSEFSAILFPFLLLFFQECKQLGFDTIELNVGSLGIPEEMLLRFIRLIKSGGLNAKPQFAVKFNKSDIPVTRDRAFGAYLVPEPRTSGMPIPSIVIG